MIKVKGLKKAFQNKTVLDGISFGVEPATVLALLGPNGAGKSTTVKILSTCLSYDDGYVEVAGYEVARYPREVRKHIAVSGQDTSLDEQLTGRENLELFARLLGLSKQDLRPSISRQLSRFGLQEAADIRVAKYSGGMKRRLDLAVALLVPPKVLFLDEPTTGLDPKSRSDVWHMIRGLQDLDIAVVLTTQYLEEADQLADRVVLIDEGQVKAEGSPEDLKIQYGRLSCAVHPLNTEDLPKVCQLLESFGHAKLDRDNGAGQVTLPQGMESIAEIVRRLDAEGIPISDLKVSPPSLNDVFHSLTQPVSADTNNGEPGGSSERGGFRQRQKASRKVNTS